MTRICDCSVHRSTALRDIMYFDPTELRGMVVTYVTTLPQGRVRELDAERAGLAHRRRELVDEISRSERRMNEITQMLEDHDLAHRHGGRAMRPARTPEEMGAHQQVHDPRTISPEEVRYRAEGLRWIDVERSERAWWRAAARFIPEYESISPAHVETGRLTTTEPNLREEPEAKTTAQPTPERELVEA